MKYYIFIMNAKWAKLIIQQLRFLLCSFYPDYSPVFFHCPEMPCALTDLKVSEALIHQHASEEAIFSRDIWEAIEGIGAAGGQAGRGLWRAAHRVGHHLSGELWVNMLKVCRASLEKHATSLFTQIAFSARWNRTEYLHKVKWYTNNLWYPTKTKGLEGVCKNLPHWGYMEAWFACGRGHPSLWGQRTHDF